MAIKVSGAARSPEALAEEAIPVCEALIGRAAVRVEVFPAPPGRMRESVRVVFPDGSVIATRRSNERWRGREVKTLRLLGQQGAPVPRVLACDGEWLLQEDVGRRRLSQIINDPAEPDPASWLDRGLRALNEVHVAARAAGLPAGPEPARRSCRRRLHDLYAAGLISRRLRLPAPAVESDRFLESLPGAGWDLLKGDPNLADFIAAPDGTMRLVDWEFARPGCALEEVARFVASETIPPEIDPAERVADLCPYAFASFPRPSELGAFLVTSTVLMIVRRLSVIASWKHSHVPWSWERGIETGMPGVAPIGIKRLCARGSRWAARLELTAPLVPWFAAVQTRLLPGGPES